MSDGWLVLGRGDVREVWHHQLHVANIEQREGTFRRRLWVARRPDGEQLCTGKDLTAVVEQVQAIAER